MITVRKDQLEALQKAAEQRKKREMVAYFRAPFPDDDDIETRVDEIFEGAKALSIEGERDLYRFAALWFLPQGAMDTPLYRKVMKLVLFNTEVPSEARLDFVEQQLLPRLPASGERTNLVWRYRPWPEQAD